MPIKQTQRNTLGPHGEHLITRNFEGINPHGHTGDDDGGYLSAGGGLSAYQIAVNNGFVGSESQWLLSLHGENGATGQPGAKGDAGERGLQGIQGPAGSDASVTKANVEAVLTGEISSHTHAGGGATVGYTINVQALTSSPADGATIYFGMLPRAPSTAAATNRVYVRKAGTIKIAEVYTYSGTAGTAENWSLYIRKNNTTDYLIATLALNTKERIFTNSSLSIPMNAGDYFEIKGVQPTWATNPLTCIYGGYVYIE